MSRTLLITCSVILVFVLFCPLIVWSQTISIFVVKGTVIDSEGDPANNGLAVEVKLVKGEEIIARVDAVTGGISNAYLLPKEIIVGRGQFAVVFPPYKSVDGKMIAASVGDKIIVQVPDLYGKKEFTYNVTESDVESEKMELRIPYFTLSLVEGQNLISIPLDTNVEGGSMIKRVSNLGTALGDSWNLIITYDSECKPQSYTPTTPFEAKSNVEIDGYTGLIVIMREPKTLKLTGKGWDVAQKVLSSDCDKHMIGIPLNDDDIKKVSDLGNLLRNPSGDYYWNVIVTFREGKSLSYTPTMDPGIPLDIDIDGDTGLIIITKGFCSFLITGAPWSDENRRVSP